MVPAASAHRSGRRITWLAWGAGAVGIALTVTAMVLSVALAEAAVASGDAEGPIKVADVAGFVGVPVVGALIAARLPRNPYGWLCCALGITTGVQSVYQVFRHAHRLPNWLPGYGERIAFFGTFSLLVLAFLLFPTGRPPGRHWRWLAYAAVLAGAVGVMATLFAPLVDDPLAAGPFARHGSVGHRFDAVVVGATVGLFVLVLLGMISVLPRYRRAGAVERQQLKWFLFAAMINAVTLVLAVLGLTEWTLSNVTFALLPAAVGIAVLRYRLYEIDRIVSRTVSYGVLTAALLALYVVLVTALGGLLEPVTGGSNLAVAGSTLAVAAVFRPARRRVQAAVDRRFDRTRYDAARTVDAYTRRLRRSVDLDEVTAGLREAVALTVGPKRVALWLRESPGPAATSPRG